MPTGAPSEARSAIFWKSEDVFAILRERGWLGAEYNHAAAPAMSAWLARASDLLGPHAADRASLEKLLALVFSYEARAMLQDASNQAVLAREGARDVIRELANRVLAGGDLDSDRLKRIVDEMKAAVPCRSRDLFLPIRVALAGMAGDGELDRVILLLDAATKLSFAMPVKGARQRMLEFCAALD
jgi:anticodon-binding protein